MKKKTVFIPYKTILTILFCTTASMCQTPPTTPVGLEEPPALGIDLYPSGARLQRVPTYLFNENKAFATRLY